MPVLCSNAVRLSCTEHADELPGGTWDALTGADDFFLSRSWLQVIEQTAGVPMRYLLAWRGGDLLAGLPTALADSSAPWLLGRPDAVLARCEAAGRPGAAGCRRLLPGGQPAALLPSLICGGRHLGRNRILTGSDADIGIQNQLVTEAEELGRGLGAVSIAFLYVDEHDQSLREHLAARGYVSFVSGLNSSLTLAPGGLEGYLNGLSSHRQRRVRAERRKLAAAGVEVTISSLSETLIPRLAELETRLYRKYGLAHWHPGLSEQALTVIHSMLKDDALVSLAYADGSIRGYALILRFRDAWYAHRAGFDYTYQGKLPIYYETLYYTPIAAAAKHGISMIHYGMGSEDTKRSRGCAGTEQRGYLLMLNS